MSVVRAIIVACGLIAIWQIVVLATGAPHYILPGPAPVLAALVDNASLLATNAGITAS